MRKLIAVGVLVGGLLAGAGSAHAQPLPGQGGIGDPLSLAASGVLMPFITSGGTVAIIEVASPVGGNSNLHLIFYNDTCVKGDSVPLPETANDIAFVIPNPFPVPTGTNGLVAIAQVDPTFQHLIPLQSAIHSRVYEFSTINGRSRVLEPIILDTFEFGFALAGRAEHFWSPLRTAATFYAPLQVTGLVETELTLICPRITIQGGLAAAFGFGNIGGFTNTGFPAIDPPFKTAPSTSITLDDMDGVVYDTDEHPLTNVHFTCDCLTPDLSVLVISPVYGLGTILPFNASKGTYTEIFVRDNLLGPTAQLGSFTGYKASFTVGSGINNFFSRLSDGSRLAIQGFPGPPSTQTPLR